MLFFTIICVNLGFFDTGVAVGIRQLPWTSSLHSTPLLLCPHIPPEASARVGRTQGLQQTKAERWQALPAIRFYQLSW